MKAKSHYLLQFFEYKHLTSAALQGVSKPFGEIASLIDMTLPENPEKTMALRKLLEAKDCAVRALLFKEPISNETAPISH
jgi:ferritin-like protein